ncbi:MAG: amidohydrolase family protein [Marinovum sp.]|nr:amidohydrolase family protein [Marinovum sp.]
MNTAGMHGMSFNTLFAGEYAWVKLSGNDLMSYQARRFADVIPYGQALIAENPNHMLWATDWPHPGLFDGMPEDGALLDALATYVASDAELRPILAHTPAAFEGFEATQDG